MSGEEEDVCAICLNSLPGVQNGEKLFLECAHEFHVYCIGAWFKTSDSCPLCKHVCVQWPFPEMPRPNLEQGENRVTEVEDPAPESDDDDFDMDESSTSDTDVDSDEDVDADEAHDLRADSANLLSTQVDIMCSSICAGRQFIISESAFSMLDPLGDFQASKIFKSLVRNSSVQNISLIGQNLSQCSIGLLAAVLKRNRSIRSVDLSGNDLNNGGAVLLARGLRKNKRITTISLAGNGVGDSGCAALLKALQKNKSVTALILRGNNLGPSSVDAFVKHFFEQNCFLKILDVSQNPRITAESMRRLKAAAEAKNCKIF